MKTIQYSIEDTYQGLYQELRWHLGKARKEKSKLPKSYDGELTYARYGLFRYVNGRCATREPYKNLNRRARISRACPGASFQTL